MGLPVFYPSMVTNFKLRFEDAFVEPPRKLPSPKTVRQAIKDSFTAPLTSTSNGKKDLKPIIVAGEKDLSHVANRIPVSAAIELPGFRQAGNFTAEFAYRDIPIMPQFIRACGIEFHLGTVPYDAFGRGMLQQGVGAMDPRRESILTPRLTDTADNPTTLLLAGVVDNWVTEFTKDGGKITITGRDLRSIFIDTPADPSLFQYLRLNQNIRDVVAHIVAAHPLGGNMKNLVYANPDDWDGKIPSPATVNGVTRVRLGAKGETESPSSMPQGAASQLSYWDLIVQYCFLVGAMPYFVGYQLRIRPVKSIYDRAKKQGIDPIHFPSPFKGGGQRAVFANGGTMQFGIRKFMFGRDIDTYKFERKYTGKQKTQAVRVISHNQDSTQRGVSGKIIEVVYPDVKIVRSKAVGGPDPQTNAVAPSGAVTANEVLTYPVAGITDKKVLLEIAKGLFEDIARGELGGCISTKNLSSLGGDNMDPDMLRLRPGDPIEVEIDKSRLAMELPILSELNEQARRDPAAQEQFLTNKLGDAKLAHAIVQSNQEGVGVLQKFFRVCNVRIGWANNGVSIDFDFQNYIEARFAGQLGKTSANKKVPVNEEGTNA